MKKENLANNWEIRLTKAQVGHYITSERYMFWHYTLGITLVVITAFVSSSFFLERKFEPIADIVAVASIMSTILAGLQMLLRPSEQSEIHRSQASKYGSLKRKIELFLTINTSKKNEDLFLQEIKSEWDSIAANSPLTPKRFRKLAGLFVNYELIENTELSNIRNNKNN